jgi:hypothetical protein
MRDGSFEHISSINIRRSAAEKAEALESGDYQEFRMRTAEDLRR